MEKIPMNRITTLLLDDYRRASSLIKEFLILNDKDVTEDKLFSLIDKLPTLKVKRIDKNYKALVMDENGYIIKSIKFNDFILDESLPVDLEKGYYKLENDEIVLDHERQRQIEEV
jgi:hypothetical protein